jgi:hypothetical protein
LADADTVEWRSDKQEGQQEKCPGMQDSRDEASWVGRKSFCMECREQQEA